MSATADAVLLPTATPARAWAVVRQLVRRDRRAVVAGAAALAAATVASLLVAPLLGHVIDEVRDGADSSFRTPMALLALAAVVQGGLTVAGSVLLARVGETGLATLREQFLARALQLPLTRLEQGGSGDLVARIGDDVTAISYAVREAVPQMVNAVLLLSLSLVALVALDWRFVLVAAVVAPLQVWAARRYVRASSPVYAEARRAEGALMSQLLESIGDAESVRALRLDGAHLESARRRIERCNDLSYEATRLETRFFGRLNVAEAIGLVAVLLTGFLLVRADRLSVGTATAAALYMVALVRPVRSALLQLDPIQSATAGLVRVVGVVDLAPPPDAAGGAGARPGDASVELEGVGFAYGDGRPAVQAVDLKIEAGSRVSLVGASGAGKSTVAKLVAGILQPDDGVVRVGGPVLLVTQEVHTFAGPLAADLRLVRPGASDEMLESALDAVGALGWVRALDAGLDTVVGAGGQALTAVQAQQVGLARVILAEPLIAVLDEATAEAGSAGARVLDAAADAALRGRTGLVVAHRLSQAAVADTVLVMDGGRVVQAGAHEDLLADGAGAYAGFWSAWRASQGEPTTTTGADPR